MKTIRTKIPARTEVRYQCSVCKKVYDTESEAKWCEEAPVEKKRFKRGDNVSGKHAHAISSGQLRTHKFVGVITKVELVSPSELRERQIVGRKHVYECYVTYTCSFCKKNNKKSYSLIFASELKPA